MTNPYATIRAALESIRVCDDMTGEREAALAALAELEKELAAAVAERDEARNLYQVRNTEWHQHELIALVLAERYKLRAEQAEARLSAIDSAPVVARPKFIRGEICGCQTRPTHYVGEMDCPWHKRGDGQPKEAKD